jgi:hypothetical protein
LIEPPAKADFEVPYLLYRPDTNSTYERPLFVKPLNNSPVSDRSALQDQLIGGPTAARHPTLVGARANAYPGIVPGFQRPPEDGPDYIQTLALPSYRSELFEESDRLDAIATDEFPAAETNR